MNNGMEPPFVRENARELYNPSCRAITMRCTSFVPSPISSTFWSR
jgi:hypothetical protein